MAVRYGDSGESRPSILVRLRRTDARNVDGQSFETLRRGLASLLHDPVDHAAAVWRTPVPSTRSPIGVKGARKALAVTVVREWPARG